MNKNLLRVLDSLNVIVDIGKPLPDRFFMNKAPALAPTETAAPYVCQSCQQAYESKFCPACGEKRLHEHDFALKHYLEESFEGLTHFDNKFFKTFKVLVTKPGLLSVYFSQGKRVAFLKPFQLFIICNLLFYLLAGHINTFSTPLSSFYKYSPYTNFGTQALVNAKAKTPQQFKLLESKFNEKMGTESKTWIVLFIPLCALAFMLVYYHKHRYFSEHLVFSTHFFAFVLAFFTIYTTVIVRLIAVVFSMQWSPTFDMWSTLAIVALLSTYIAISGRRFYNVSVTGAGIRAVIVTAFFFICIMIYRMLLFYKIMHAIS